MRIEPILVDTNVLLEATDKRRKYHREAVRFLEAHVGLRTAAQVIREYLAVASRPVDRNGLGLSISDALSNVREFRRSIRLLPEEKPTLPKLLALLEEVPCAGKRVHDAHLAATAQVHRVKTIVSFNTSDFLAFRAHVSAKTPVELLRAAP